MCTSVVSVGLVCTKPWIHCGYHVKQVYVTPCTWMESKRIDWFSVILSFRVSTGPSGLHETVSEEGGGRGSKMAPQVEELPTEPDDPEPYYGVDSPANRPLTSKLTRACSCCWCVCVGGDVPECMAHTNLIFKNFGLLRLSFSV